MNTYAIPHTARRTKTDLSPDRPRGADAIIYLLTFVPVAAVLATAWFQPIYPVAELLRDPLAVAEASDDCCHVHYGLLSNLGVLLWCATSSMLLYAALLAVWFRQPRGVLVFLMTAALFTGWLLLDDLFMVHEDVLPQFGVSQHATYIAYGCLGLAYLAVNLRLILKARVTMLAVAIALLGFSVVIDWFVHVDSDLRLLLEDGAKLGGIAAWFAFHVEAAFRMQSTGLAGEAR